MAARRTSYRDKRFRSLASEMNRKQGGGVQWGTLLDLLGGSAKAGEVQAVITRNKNEVTDHLPVLTRFGR